MTTRRPILAAALVVTATLAGLALYAYCHVHGLDARDAADELAVLRDLSRGRIVSLHDSNRIASALIRLRASGHAVRREAAYYLTRAGWARTGRVFSEEEIALLANRSSWAPDTVVHRLRTEGLFMWDRWQPTPAGRAALEREV